MTETEVKALLFETTQTILNLQSRVEILELQFKYKVPSEIHLSMLTILGFADTFIEYDRLHKYFTRLSKVAFDSVLKALLRTEYIEQRADNAVKITEKAKCILQQYNAS